jgi:hypothetical protein
MSCLLELQFESSSLGIIDKLPEELCYEIYEYSRERQDTGELFQELRDKYLRKVLNFTTIINRDIDFILNLKPTIPDIIETVQYRQYDTIASKFLLMLSLGSRIKLRQVVK